MDHGWRSGQRNSGYMHLNPNLRVDLFAEDNFALRVIVHELTHAVDHYLLEKKEPKMSGDKKNAKDSYIALAFKV